MLFIVVGGLALGVFLGSRIVDARPVIRRGVPILIFVLGLIAFRMGIADIGIDAVQAGNLSTSGKLGIFLMLTGLVALLAIVLAFTGGEVAKSSRLQRRKKRR